MSELKSLNITVVKDLPSIGSNLFDHINMPLYVSIDTPISLTKEKVINAAEILKYLLHGNGFYSNFGVIGFATNQTTLNGEAVGLFGAGSIDEKLFRDVSNYNEQVMSIQANKRKFTYVLQLDFQVNVPFVREFKSGGNCFTVYLSSSKVTRNSEIETKKS